MLIRDGAVTEGTSSNVYAVINGTVRTHPANELILNGITRMKLLELMKENGIEVREKALTEDELRDADEIFISSTTSELIPIVTLDGKPVGSGSPGPVAKTIQEAFQSHIQQEVGVQS